MLVTINGEQREIGTGTTISSLLESFKLTPRTVVVEYNGEIPERTLFAEVILKESDVIEIVQMMAGG